MVKFKGRSSLKQYMPMKPIKRGFKVWCRCDSHNGFTCCFQVYLGKTDSVETGLGVRVILDMACDILNKGFHIYCNNFFACPELAAKLGMNKTYCIGTVRSIRVGFTKFNPTQIKGMKIGEDISNIESFEINPRPPIIIEITVKWIAGLIVMQLINQYLLHPLMRLTLAV